MPAIELSTGATFHYEDLGQGEPVILVHGLLGTARVDFGDTLEWVAEQGYHVLGPSLRGYGQSTPKPRDFPDNFYHRDADDLIAFMDALNIDKAHLFGYSDGGEVVMIVAGQHPDRCLSMLTVGAVGNFGPELRPAFQRVYPGSWIKQDILDLHQIPDADVFARGWVRATTRMVDAGGDISLSLASHITCPVMITLGKTDTLNPEAYGQRFAEKIPDGRGRVQMFDCGHAIHQEKPADFRAAAVAFWQQAK